MTEVAVDTNIFAYAEGLGDEERVIAATDILLALGGRIVLCTQVIGELYNVMVRKAKRHPQAAAAAIELWQHDTRIVETGAAIFWRALNLAATGGLQIWDAVILATAEDAGCEILLSEDMQHGFQWRRITIVNPFILPLHPLLTAVLKAKH